MVLVGFLAGTLKAQQDEIGVNELAGQEQPIITSVPFLIIAPDSRSSGTGDIGAASSPDLASQHWNVAKYAFYDKNVGASLSYSPWLKNLGITDINLLYATFFLRLDERQTTSMSLRYFSLGELNLTNERGDEIGYVNPNEWALDAGYTLKLSERFSGGVVFRFIYSDLTGGMIDNYSSGIAGAADLGFYYQQPVEVQGNGGEMAFGLNLSNIGTKISYTEDSESDFLPMNMRLGGRLSIDLDEYNSVSFLADVNKYLVPTPPVYKRDENGDFVRDDNNDLIIEKGTDPNVSMPVGIMRSFYDAPGGFEEEMHEIMWSLGAEYWYQDQFALRAGYFNEHQEKGNRKFLSLGVGLKLNVLGIDFSYLVPSAGRTSPLANTVRFTLNFNFDEM
jgi:hypothetical protein